MNNNSPLNPRLYNALVKAFKHVRINDAGVPMRIGGYRSVPIRGGRRRLRADIINYGETYVVSCPLCTDLRKRLYINHRWAQRDPVSGDLNLHLCHCFNEECTSTGAKQWELARRVFGWGKGNDPNDDDDAAYPEGQRVRRQRPRGQCNHEEWDK